MTYITPPEAMRLTRDLGDSWRGNAYANNVEVRTLRETKAGQELGQQDYVREQVERSREILRPYIGRIAWGTSPWLVMNENGEWTKNRIYTEYTGGWVQQAEGTIKDIEAHTFRIKKFESRTKESDFYKQRVPGRQEYSFHIGVVLHSLTTIDMGIQELDPLPQPDEVMIPIHDFQLYPNGVVGHLDGKWSR